MTASIPTRHAGATHLQQIIARLTEGIIILEPSGALSWADDTALELHGAATLADLGRTAADYAERFQLAYRGGEKLSPADYPMQQLLRGEAIDRALIQVTRRADGRCWVHEIRTMVLTDGAGTPDSLVVILNDETERFNAEERFERAFAANPAPAIIVRLADMRYVKVNTGFLELTGFQQGALIGHSMHEIDVLRGAERRDLAVARLHAGDTIPQMEGCLVTADGRDKTVLLGGQPLTVGDAACMLFTFADLHPRRQAEEALRQSEARFSKAFGMAPGPMAILALDGLRLLDVNSAFTAATGWRREEIIGRGEAEIGMWDGGTLREDALRHIKQTGRVHSADIKLRGKNGALHDCLLSADTVEINGERCVLSVMQDITERKRTETELMDAVQAVLQDTSFLGQAIVEKLATLTRAKGSADAPELSALPARAREVLGLVAQGLDDPAIATKLGITRNTLRNHIAAIYARIGVNRRSALVVWARERGLGAPAKPRAKRTKTKPARGV